MAEGSKMACDLKSIKSTATVEKKLASVCSRLAEHRPAHEVLWLASFLRGIPALKHIPVWKLENLGRYMTVSFAQKGEDASLLCSDASCSYFVVNGSLLPVVDTGEQATPPVFVAAPILQSSSRSASRPAPPDQAGAVVAEVKHSPQSTHPRAPKGGNKQDSKQGLDYRVACGVEGLPVPACCSWTFSCDDNSSAMPSAWTCAAQTKHSGLMDLTDNGSIAIKNIASKRPTPAKAGTPPPAPEAKIAAPDAGTATPIAKIAQDPKRVEVRPIFPGQSLDLYLVPIPPGEVEEIGPEGDCDEARCPEAFPANPEGSFGEEAARRRWRLEAREGVCVGRVSRHFLRWLELEEPKHDVEVKVAFLRRTEVFGEGFSVAALRRLASVMERQEQPEATVVRRKGSAANSAVMVESGEAVRLGDPQADTKKTSTSLRIKAGQIFGAEEVLSGLPVYTANLMTLSPLRFFAIPAAAFLEATGGIWTKPLYRLRSRARVVNHGWRTHSRRHQHRPSTATGEDSARFLGRKWSSGETFRGENSLPNLLLSKTRNSPLTLTPVPLFSGHQGCRERGLEERMNTMAAVWTPWSWSSRDGSRTGGDAPSPRHQHAPSPRHHQQENGQPRPKQRERQERERGEDEHKPSASAAASLSRPRSAPAPITRGISAPALPRQHDQQAAQQPELDGDDDNDDPSSPLSHEKPTRSRSAGDLPRRLRNGGPAVEPGGALSLSGAGMGEGSNEWGHGDGASSVVSPDFRRLGPSDLMSTPLAGCDFNGLATGLAGGPSPLAVGGEKSRRSVGESRSQPKTLMISCRRSSSPNQGGRRPPGHQLRRKNARKTRERKNTENTKKPPAACLSAATPDTERGGRPFSFSLEGGVCVGGGGFEIVDSSSDGGGGSNSARRDLSRAPLPLSSQPSSASSLGSTSVSIAATLDLWDNRELAAAKRAVSSRPHRSRLCLAMRAQESTSAGMAAAQRSLRAAFVMSKMGNAKERSGWRP